MKQQHIIIIIILSFFSCRNYNNQDKEETSSVKPIIKDSTLIIIPDTISDNDQLNEIFDNWLKIDISEEIILEKLGKPDSIMHKEYWDALGTYIQKWFYPERGILLEMESSEENSMNKVFSITIETPCKMSTRKHISIGVPIKKVNFTYQHLINKEYSNENEIVIGSIYEGTIFYFKNGIVNKIFVGSLLE